MNNPEKLATQGTQEGDKQSKNTKQYVLGQDYGHHNTQTNRNKVNKTNPP